MDHGKSPVKTSLKIAKDAIVCNEAEVIGDVTIGSGTIIHPKARIQALSGPIVIGDNNLIEEQVEIINCKEQKDGAEKTETSQKGKVLIIGNGNLFEVGARCESLQVGDNNVIRSKAHVGRKVTVTKACMIGAKCRLAAKETLAENTVIVGLSHQRRKHTEEPHNTVPQLEFLRKILPNYHRLLKSTQ